MKNILIINLRRIGDVYTTGHLINSLSKVEGNAVSMLTYLETENAASNLKNLTNLYTINRKEIITLKTNKLFSDGFALEQLFSQLQEIRNQKWDEIVNYSNDLVSSYLCSYLSSSTEKIIGVHFNEERQPVTSNNWDMLFNDILSSINYTPLHFVDCYHKMLGISHTLEGEKVITSPNNNSTAFSNISTIRKTTGTTESITKIIGIQIKSSDSAKDIPRKVITDLIALLKKTSELIPILLIGPFENERKYAEKINKEFNNEINVVEADLHAIASVLLNIDILITPDTAIKHIADLTETPVIEVSLGYAPFLKQGSYVSGSLILSDIISERNFTKNSNSAVLKTNITASDINASILYFFSKTKSIRPSLSNDVTLYACSFDQLGARYLVVAGTVNSQIEIHRLMSRELINVIYNNNNSADTYSNITDFGANAISTWCKNESTNLTNVMRDLLGTLRSLLQSQENKKSSRDFVINLGKLIVHTENNSIIQIPISIFKSKIESISSKTFDENAKAVENILYELKANIQKALICIKRLEDENESKRKEDFMSRSVR